LEIHMRVRMDSKNINIILIAYNKLKSRMMFNSFLYYDGKFLIHGCQNYYNCSMRMSIRMHS